LEEALAHIQELLHTLNSKIEEIDLVFVLAVQDGHEALEDQSSSAQDRQLKRSQLLMLKENIDVIADNLKSLIQRSKQTGSALFDVAAIESVISEAATLLVLLNSDEEDDGEVEEVEEAEDFVEDVKNIDEMVAKIEEEVVEIEEQITSAPEANNEDSSIRASVMVRQSTYSKEPVSDLEVNANNFDPNDPSKRPEEWRDVLMKRVLKKEQADRENGIDEDTISASRAAREKEEDALMVKEVATHGKVLGLKTGGRKRSATLQQDVSTFDINPDNFDAANPAKRPGFWTEVRTKRVMLKEHIDRINGTSESAIVDHRPIKEIDVSCFLSLSN
jgi:hypothetical protein